MSWFRKLFRRNRRPIQGFQTIDFVRAFPHVCWVSAWGQDDAFPQGYCYKVLSHRLEPEHMVEVILLRELRDGTKSEVARLRGAVGNFAAIDQAVAKLGFVLSVSFERFDMTDCRTAEEYKTKAAKLGWEVVNEEEAAN